MRSNLNYVTLRTTSLACAGWQSFDDSLHTMRGSIPWMSPEMVKQTGHGRSADVWSVGATMIEMYTARYPWPPFSNNMAAMYHVATATEVGPLVARRLYPLGVDSAFRFLSHVYDRSMWMPKDR